MRPRWCDRQGEGLLRWVRKERLKEFVWEEYHRSHTKDNMEGYRWDGLLQKLREF